MGCGSCGTKDGLPKGCNNNGACGTDGCGKLSVFDWLSNMKLPNGQEPFNFIEVRFKNDRKFYYKNENNMSLNVGEVIAVEGTPGHDIGVVTLAGELVRIQMKKKHISQTGEDVKKVYRKANQKDIETWQEFREREKQTMIDSRIMAKNLNLEMKICDVEYQGDGSKVTFYYTAEGRVDFRQLIKEYASKFGVRIEMKQIGYRQEAAKIGGIGSCGRELCCSTWLTDFRSVSTAAARYQQLSINSQKLAGQCGKLKCCLNFELDSYLDALNHFPSIESKFDTVNGVVHCVKIDVFKKEMWFAYEKGSMLWFKFAVSDVQEFLAMNERKEKTDSLEDLTKQLADTKPISVDVIEEDSLERFERKEQQAKRKRMKAKKPGNNPASNPNQQTKNGDKQTEKPANANRPQKRRKPTQPKENVNASKTPNPVKTDDTKKPNPKQRRPNPKPEKKADGNTTAAPTQKPEKKVAQKPRPTHPNVVKNAGPNSPQPNTSEESKTTPNKSRNRNKNRSNRGPKPNNPNE